MRTDALFRRYELFVAAAIVAAHASANRDGFRQRDVRFLIELFSNWIEASLDEDALSLSNTQVLRYLESLVEDGFARKSLKNKKPHYSLSRVGLIELLSRMNPGKELIKPEQFCFLNYFLKNYSNLITELIEKEGKQFPFALKIEVEGLLDTKALLASQLTNVGREISKLEERINDSKEGSKLSLELFQSKTSIEEVSRRVEERYPYQMNSQKPLSELMKSIPKSLAKWELEYGGARRAEQLFEPSLKLLVAYQELLSEMT